MKVFVTTTFEKAMKKLHPKDKDVVSDAIEEIIKSPTIGEAKVGDLKGIRVYKFPLNRQKVLMAYKYADEGITLLDLSSHENFYRDLKKRI